MKNNESGRIVFPDHSVREAAELLSALRSFSDAAVLIEPYQHEIWDIDENGELLPVPGAYGGYRYDGPASASLSLASVTEGKAMTRCEKNDDGYCRITCIPVTAGGKPFALETVCIFDDAIRTAADPALLLEQAKNLEVIRILASEYTSVYYIDLTTDELTPYTMNEETETTFGSVFRSGITYSEAYKLYVDKLIYDADKQMMLKAGSLENIRHELTGKKTFLTQYRSADNKYSEMKFVKVGDDNDEPLAVALGFAEKDEEIRREQQIAEEQQRNTDIIGILASEYSSVYYIDLTTDELTPYTMNEETETEFGKIFRSGIRYSEAYRMYVNTLIHTEDKQMMLSAGSIGNIMKALKIF